MAIWRRLHNRLALPLLVALAITSYVCATAYTGERTAKNYDFVDAVARKNVELTLADIRRRSPTIAGLEGKGTIKLAGAMYNLESAVVDFLPTAPAR